MTSGYLSKVTQLASNCSMVYYYLDLWSLDSSAFVFAKLFSSGAAWLATIYNIIWSWCSWILLMNHCISVYSGQKSITEKNYFSPSSLMKHFERATENLHKYWFCYSFLPKDMVATVGAKKKEELNHQIYFINHRSTKMKPRYFFIGKNLHHYCRGFLPQACAKLFEGLLREVRIGVSCE